MQRFLRTFSILFIVVLFSAISCDSPQGPEQNVWEEYRLPGSVASVSDIFFNDPSDGWACTSNGYIFHYDGKDWSFSGYFETGDEYPDAEFDYFNIFDVDFSTPNDGWAVGRTLVYPYQSGIFHYDGEKWSDVTPDNIESYGMYAVCAVAPDDVWLGGALGVLIHYDGTSFEAVEGPAGGKIWAIQFVDEDFGIAAESGQLLYYDGVSWRNDVYPICNIGIGNQGGLWFTSRDDGWVVGGFNSGDEIPIYPVAMRFDGERWYEVDITDEHVIFTDVCFKDKQEGWIVGFGAWKITGKRSTKIPIPSHYEARCVWVTETGDIWVSCNNGTILKYKG